MVEQPAVNRLVVGSNPTRGAKFNQRLSENSESVGAAEKSAWAALGAANSPAPRVCLPGPRGRESRRTCRLCKVPSEGPRSSLTVGARLSFGASRCPGHAGPHGVATNVPKAPPGPRAGSLVAGGHSRNEARHKPDRHACRYSCLPSRASFARFAAHSSSVSRSTDGGRVVG